MKELLLKGENLQKRVPDQDKREQLRLKHNQLNSKYNTVKVTADCKTPDIYRKSESLSGNTRSSDPAAQINAVTIKHVQHLQLDLNCCRQKMNETTVHLKSVKSEVMSS